MGVAHERVQCALSLVAVFIRALAGAGGHQHQRESVQAARTARANVRDGQIFWLDGGSCGVGPLTRGTGKRHP